MHDLDDSYPFWCTSYGAQCDLAGVAAHLCSRPSKKKILEVITVVIWSVCFQLLDVASKWVFTCIA